MTASFEERIEELRALVSAHLARPPQLRSLSSHDQLIGKVRALRSELGRSGRSDRPKERQEQDKRLELLALKLEYTRRVMKKIAARAEEVAVVTATAALDEPLVEREPAETVGPGAGRLRSGPRSRREGSAGAPGDAEWIRPAPRPSLLAEIADRRREILAVAGGVLGLVAVVWFSIPSTTSDREGGAAIACAPAADLADRAVILRPNRSAGDLDDEEETGASFGAAGGGGESAGGESTPPGARILRKIAELRSAVTVARSYEPDRKLSLPARHARRMVDKRGDELAKLARDLDPAGLEALVALAGDPDPHLSAHASRAIANADGPQVAAAILAGLGRPVADVSPIEIWFAGVRGIVAAREPILAIAIDRRATMMQRAAALDALGRIGTPADMPVLLGLVADETLGEDAADAAASVARRAIRAGATRWELALFPGSPHGWQARKLSSLLRVEAAIGDGEAVRALGDAARSPDALERLAAANALRLHPVPAAQDLVRELARDTDSAVRSEARAALEAATAPTGAGPDEGGGIAPPPASRPVGGAGFAPGPAAFPPAASAPPTAGA